MDEGNGLAIQSDGKIVVVGWTYNGSSTDVYTMRLSNGINPLSITTASLPAGTVGTAYNQSVSATGGVIPYAWSISAGSLPTGLVLDAGNGAITGTPTATGTFNFTVQVADSQSPTPATATKALSIQINAQSGSDGGGGGGGGAVGPLAVGISALLGWWKRRKQKQGLGY